MPLEGRVGGDEVGRLGAGGDDEVLVAQQRQQAQLAAAAGLRRAEHVALAALLDVEAGQLEAVGGGRDGVQPLAGRRAGLGVGDEQAEPRQAAAADPAAQLVQLRDAEAVGVQDRHDGGVGDVDADLDDGGRDQDVEPPGGEVGHRAVLVLGREPAVQRGDAQPVQRPSASIGSDVLDARAAAGGRAGRRPRPASSGSSPSARLPPMRGHTT